MQSSRYQQPNRTLFPEVPRSICHRYRHGFYMYVWESSVCVREMTVWVGMIVCGPQCENSKVLQVRVATVQGRASLVHVQRNFLDFRFFLLDTDNFTARDPWTWRWKEETSVMPYASELDTAAQPQVGQHVGPAKSSLSNAWGITLVFSLQHQVHGSLSVKLSMSRGKISEIQKISLDMDKGSPPLDIAYIRERMHVLVNMIVSGPHVFVPEFYFASHSPLLCGWQKVGENWWVKISGWKCVSGEIKRVNLSGRFSMYKNACRNWW